MTDPGEWRPAEDGISASSPTWWFEYRGHDRESFVISVSHGVLEWDAAKALAAEIAANPSVRAMARDLEELGRDHAITVRDDPETGEHATVWRKS